MRDSSWKRILVPLVWFFLLMGVARAAPPPVQLPEEKLSADLTGHLEILKDQTRLLVLRDVAGRKDWSGPVRERVPNLGITGAAVWIRFSLANRAEASRKFYVSFEYPVADSVTVYTEGPPGFFGELHAGDSVPASANMVPDRHFLFPVTIGPNETVAVYLRVQSTASMTLPLRVLSDRALSRKASRDYTVYGVLFGFLMLVLIYFLAVGASLLQGICLWFSLYSVLFGLHAAVRGGFIRLIMPDDWLGINNLLSLLIIGGLYFTGAKFYRIFLTLKNYPKPFDAIMAFLQYLSVPFVLLALSPNQLTPLVSLVLLVIGPLFSISLSF